jgi:hypothetical protein
LYPSSAAIAGRPRNLERKKYISIRQLEILKKIEGPSETRAPATVEGMKLIPLSFELADNPGCWPADLLFHRFEEFSRSQMLSWVSEAEPIYVLLAWHGFDERNAYIDVVDGNP